MDFSALIKLMLGICLFAAVAATAQEGSYRPGSRLVRLKSIEERPDWSVSLGAIYYFPLVNVQYAVNDRYAISLTPTIFHYTYKGLTSGLAGGFFGINGYSDDIFKGVWCQAALGVFHSASTYGIFNETQLSLAALVTIGYRFRTGNFNVGLALGGEYHDLQKSKDIPHSYLLAPVTWIDLGWAF